MVFGFQLWIVVSSEFYELPWGIFGSINKINLSPQYGTRLFCCVHMQRSSALVLPFWKGWPQGFALFGKSPIANPWSHPCGHSLYLALIEQHSLLSPSQSQPLHQSKPHVMNLIYTGAGPYRVVWHFLKLETGPQSTELGSRQYTALASCSVDRLDVLDKLIWPSASCAIEALCYNLCFLIIITCRYIAWHCRLNHNQLASINIAMPMGRILHSPVE